MEGGEDVRDGVAAETDFGEGFADVDDADAGDYNVGGSAAESEGAFAGLDVEDVALGYGEIIGDGGFRDAFFEEHGFQFGGCACHWVDVSGRRAGMIFIGGGTYMLYSHIQL